MNLGSIIIGAILAALCSVPFIIMHLSRKKRERNNFNALTEISKQHHGQITKHEFCGGYLIGLDEVNNFVFFHKQRKDIAITKFVDLATIGKCEVNTSFNKATQAIDRLELAFIPKDKDGQQITLEFFDVNVSFQLQGELQSIESWAKLINSRLV